MEFLIILIIVTLWFGSAAAISFLGYYLGTIAVLGSFVLFIGWLVSDKKEIKVEEPKKHIILPAKDNTNEWNKLLYIGLFFITLVGFAFL